MSKITQRVPYYAMISSCAEGYIKTIGNYCFYKFYSKCLLTEVPLKSKCRSEDYALAVYIAR